MPLDQGDKKGLTRGFVGCHCEGCVYVIPGKPARLLPLKVESAQYNTHDAHISRASIVRESPTSPRADVFRGVRRVHIVSSGEWLTALELLSGSAGALLSKSLLCTWPLLYQKPPTHLRQ